MKAFIIICSGQECDYGEIYSYVSGVFLDEEKANKECERLQELNHMDGYEVEKHEIIN